MSSNYRGYEECPNYGVRSYARPSFTTRHGEKEAAQSAVRMLDENKTQGGGHAGIYRDFKEIMDLQVLSDKMPVRHDFEARFEIEITEREECVNQTTSPGALVYYTDGSRKNGLVRMGIYGPSIRYFEALGSTPIIFKQKCTR
jgi:hypothetical protein